MNSWAKAISIIVPLGVFALAQIPLHEYGHALGAMVEGCSYKVHFGYPWEGARVGNSACFNDWLFGLSGGLFVFLVYGALWFIARLTPSLDDVGMEFACALWGLLNLCIGIGEALDSGLYGMIAATVIIPVVFWFYCTKEVRRFADREG